MSGKPRKVRTKKAKSRPTRNDLVLKKLLSEVKTSYKAALKSSNDSFVKQKGFELLAAKYLEACGARPNQALDVDKWVVVDKKQPRPVQ